MSKTSQGAGQFPLEPEFKHHSTDKPVSRSTSSIDNREPFDFKKEIHALKERVDRLECENTKLKRINRFNRLILFLFKIFDLIE